MNSIHSTPINFYIRICRKRARSLSNFPKCNFRAELGGPISEDDFPTEEELQQAIEEMQAADNVKKIKTEDLE